MSSPVGSSIAGATPRFFAIAVPFLGILGAVQGSAPNINSTALVSVTRDLNMTGGSVALAASIQTIAIAGTVITTGLLADRLGRRRVLLAGLLIGVAGSAISGLAPVSLIYLLGQMLTGIGLGAVYAAAFGFINAVAKPGKLAAALGLFGATIGLTTLIMTFAGGALAGVNWRLGYFVTAIVGAICFFVTPMVLPHITKLKNTNLDIGGQLLLGVGVIGFLYGVSQLGRSLTAPQTLLPLIGGTICLVLFFIVEAKYKKSFYPVQIFKSPFFIAAILAGFIYNFGTAVAFLQTTNLWQYVTDVPTRDIAYWQLPLIGAGIVGALVTGRLMAKGLSNRGALAGGAVITGVGFALLALAASAKSFLAFLPGLVLVGAGLLVVSIPFGNLIIKEAPPDKFGPVTSSRTTIGQFFYSIGFALGTVFIDRLTMGGVVKKLTDAGVQPDLIGTAVTSVNQYVQTQKQPSTEVGKQALADAVTSYSASFASLMWVCAVLVIVAGLVAFMLLRRANHHPQGAANPAPSPSA